MNTAVNIRPFPQNCEAMFQHMIVESEMSISHISTFVNIDFNSMLRK